MNMNCVNTTPILSPMPTCMRNIAGTSVHRATRLTIASGNSTSTTIVEAARNRQSIGNCAIHTPRSVGGLLLNLCWSSMFAMLSDHTHAINPDQRSLAIPAAKNTSAESSHMHRTGQVYSPLRAVFSNGGPLRHERMTASIDHASPQRLSASTSIASTRMPSPWPVLPNVWGMPSTYVPLTSATRQLVRVNSPTHASSSASLNTVCATDMPATVGLPTSSTSSSHGWAF